MTVDVVILAAGQGKRMKSALPKVLHPLGGKPLLGHVLDNLAPLSESPPKVVIGHGGESVKAAFAGADILWLTQAEQKGTGHAVAQALPHVRDDATVLIAYGDVPLIGIETYRQLVAASESDSLGLLTVEMADPAGYGRIVRDDSGTVVAIVEEKDASEKEKAIREINTGVMAVPGARLQAWLPALDSDNAQGEYYLTDIIAMARRDGVTITVVQPDNSYETEGVNSRSQLQRLERIYQKTLAERLMDAGVTVADAERFDCRGTLTCGADSYIDINAVFEGEVVMGSGVTIGPGCYIANASLGDGVHIKANSVIEGPVNIEADVQVGPFARLRPGTLLRRGSRIGNFVETKKSEIGEGSKVNHLSYVGDTTIGVDANIGAGTITCNYDGVNKFNTTIGDGAFIGSNTALVAPVKIGCGATVGAGSTITRDVDDNTLAVARGWQKTIDNWKRPEKETK